MQNGKTVKYLHFPSIEVNQSKADVPMNNKKHKWLVLVLDQMKMLFSKGSSFVSIKNAKARRLVEP